MITATQLAEFARKNHIGRYYQEKDYLQVVLLYSLYSITDGLVLKGGTCLKLVHRYPRFSEDIDFGSTLGAERLRALVRRALRGVALFGIGSSFDREELFKRAYTARIRFKGPRYSGAAASTNAIQLDVGARGGIIRKPRWVQIAPEYPDVPRFFLLTMTKEEILAEKLRALSMRSTSRDLFDAWCLVQDGVKADRRLIETKMKAVGMKIDEEMKLPNKNEYERDLRNLLPMSRVPDYRQVVKELKDALRRM